MQFSISAQKAFHVLNLPVKLTYYEDTLKHMHDDLSVTGSVAISGLMLTDLSWIGLLKDVLWMTL